MRTHESNAGQQKIALLMLHPAATLKVWPGYDHCGRITADSDAYAAMLRALIG